MRANPSLPPEVADAVVKVFAPPGTSYMPTPTADQVLDRTQAGTCPVCDVRAKGCWCRACPACRRYWLAQKSARRDPEALVHHGIRAETCPPCAAREGATS